MYRSDYLILSPNLNKVPANNKANQILVKYSYRDELHECILREAEQSENESCPVHTEIEVYFEFSYRFGQRMGYKRQVHDSLLVCSECGQIIC